MRIIQVLLDPRIGGAETVAETLDSEWRKCGVETKIVYVEGVAYERTSRLSRCKRLRRAIVDFNADIILAHTETPSVYARLSAPRGVPVLPVLHSGINYIVNRRQKLFERVLQLRTSGIVAVGHGQKVAYAEATGWSGSIDVIPNPIRSDILFKLRGPSVESRALVGNIARIIDSKDPFFWCRVAEHALEQGLDADFAWWGPLGQSSACLDLVDEVSSRGDSRIVFCGATQDVPSVLEQFDVFFSPSKWEAFSLSIHEAALAGVPIVCTREVGATLDPRIKRFEYETGDLNGAITAIDRGLRVDRAELRSGSRYVAEELSPSSIAQSYLDVLSRYSN